VPELPLDRGEHRVEVGEIADVRANGEDFRLPSVSLAACSRPLFKPQMATRAPSLSNSCAAASPIPLFAAGDKDILVR